MALITIRDLPQSDDLDRQAMRSISGGGRIDVQPALLIRRRPAVAASSTIRPVSAVRGRSRQSLSIRLRSHAATFHG